MKQDNTNSSAPFRVSLAVVLMLCASAGLAADSEGERLVYILGCVNCHHQTPKEIMKAPPLLIVKAYSLEQLTTLLRTGMTSSGRDMYDLSSIMGVIAVEQFSYLTEDEIRLIHEYLTEDWTHEQALVEEAKIPRLFRKKLERADPK